MRPEGARVSVTPISCAPHRCQQNLGRRCLFEAIAMFAKTASQIDEMGTNPHGAQQLCTHEIGVVNLLYVQGVLSHLYPV